jgi:FAD/FMN-containing dehydrogenase
VLVNDIHSRLNPTEVARVVEVDSVEALQSAVRAASAEGSTIAISGGRHAMGGQQFASGGVLVDTRNMDRVVDLDTGAGLIEVEAGIQWPALVAFLASERAESPTSWGIAQKQTGADRFTIGGSISANGHGRGLAMAPMSADVLSLRLVTPDANVVECSRAENAELFRLVLGGYGLFGAIATVTLRLAPRIKLERVVELLDVGELQAAFDARIAAGFLYGDFQFAIDAASPQFLRRGVFSCYRPADPDRPIASDQRALTREDWQRLLMLAHTDKSRAFDAYARHYASTSGQLYWSDLHQLGDYTDGYHEVLDQALRARHPATEMIGELYVPRDLLADFMSAAADGLRGMGSDVIYGTIRLVEPDEDTFLPWATQRLACAIFNIHTVHTEAGIAGSVDAFRHLIDLAIERGGSYFLTYHRWATREQVLACYPQMPELVRRKRIHDPDELFMSDWYTHQVALVDGQA